MKKALAIKIHEALISVLPITAIVLITAFTPLAGLTVREMIIFSVSALFLILGIALFNLGADMAMTPMGEHVGEGLTKSRKIGILLAVSFVMGLLITIAEPDLSVLAGQVSAVMNETALIWFVGIGVGLFLLIGVFKIVLKKDIAPILLFFYMTLFALAALLLERDRGSFLPLGFDSGGVTTGPITVPFIMALGVGIAMTIGGRNADENSFGLIALCSVGPIIAVMVLSLMSEGENLTYSLPDYSMDSHLGDELWKTIVDIVGDVGRSLFLVVLSFVILQIIMLKLPKKKLVQIFIGIIYTFIGLVIFLVSATVGFMPIGFKMGTELASGGNIALISFAFVIGMVVVLAEPAVHVLNKQVEDVTGGSVTKREMMIALSIVYRTFGSSYYFRFFRTVLFDPGLSYLARTVVLCSQAVYRNCFRFRRSSERTSYFKLYSSACYRSLCQS